MASLNAKIKKTRTNKICIELDKEDFESFCNACGLFREEFLELLEASEKDHKEGRITERKSLFELIDK